MHQKIPLCILLEKQRNILDFLQKTIVNTCSLKQAAQVSEPPAAPKGMSIPPPPPPEPPKVEIKGEPAAKPVKTTPKEEPKAAAKEAESKGKSAKDALSKFFRPKVNTQEFAERRKSCHDNVQKL